MLYCQIGKSGFPKNLLSIAQTKESFKFSNQIGRAPNFASLEIAKVGHDAQQKL